jgi:hypothetical protein
MLRRTRKPKADMLWHWLSVSKRIDGLLVGTWESDANAEAVFRRVEGALCLIKAHDRLRYKRLLRDLERLRVWLLPGGSGSYKEAVRSCELDSRFVLAETSSPAMIASTIVHEATHARLMRCGIGYETELRARVEAVCARRELAFANNLPNGAQVRESAERILELCAADDGYWSNTAFEERHVEGWIEAMRHLGVPDWLVRVFLIFRSLNLSIRRGIRGVTRRSVKRS